MFQSFNAVDFLDFSIFQEGVGWGFKIKQTCHRFRSYHF